MSLRVVDPTYCELTRQALRHDSSVLVVLGEYGQREATVRAVGTIAQIVHHKALEDGTFHLLLLGVERARIVEHLETGFRFQSVRAELMSERNGLVVGMEPLRSDLCHWLPELLDSDLARRELSETLGDAEDDQLVATAVTLLEMPTEAKQSLLEAETTLDRLLAVHGLVQQGLGRGDSLRDAATMN